ncbi:hypothetical protein Tco_0971207 [Tanacetum coccineum]
MEDGIFVNQSKYIKEMLKKFRLEDSKPMKTPMSSDTKLTKDEECESVDSTKYRGMIGSLLYLMASRPDIKFGVCLCARFQEDPKTSHLEAVKRIFRYVKGTTHLRLWYPKGTGIETIVYADSDHAGDYVDQKSTSEMLKNLESHCIHEGQVVYPDFDDLVYVRSMFGHIGCDCLLDINEQIIPRFILEFYCQYRVNYTLEGQMLIEFVIQNQFFSYTLEEFGQILGIPVKWECSFTDKWSLDDLKFSVSMGS